MAVTLRQWWPRHADTRATSQVFRKPSPQRGRVKISAVFSQELRFSTSYTALRGMALHLEFSCFLYPFEAQWEWGKGNNTKHWVSSNSQDKHKQAPATSVQERPWQQKTPITHFLSPRAVSKGSSGRTDTIFTIFLKEIFLLFSTRFFFLLVSV